MDKMNHVERYTLRDTIPKASAYTMPGIRRKPLAFSKPLARKMLQCLADYYKVPLSLLTGIRRDQPYPYIRHLFVYWIRNKFGSKATLTKLGDVLDRDHTTIINSERVYQERLNTDDKLRPGERVHSNTIREDYLKTSKFLQSCLMEIKVDS
jgi:hypothetical protein